MPECYTGNIRILYSLEHAFQWIKSSDIVCWGACALGTMGGGGEGGAKLTLSGKNGTTICHKYVLQCREVVFKGKRI